MTNGCRNYKPLLKGDILPFATPVITMQLSVNEVPCTLLLKLELHSLYGSIKGRTASALWDNIAADVDPDIGVIESTSGNLGLALAGIATSHGVRFTAVVDPRSSTSVVEGVRECGGHVVVVDRQDGAGGYLLSRLAYIREQLHLFPGLIWPNQYESPANPWAHASGTAPELWSQTREPMCVLVAVSTGGTLAGFSQYLTSFRPPWELIAVDVTGSVAVGGTVGWRVLSGIGASQPSAFLPGGYQPVIRVSPDEAISACLWLSEVTGIDVGGSSGALIAAALRLFRCGADRTRIACVCPDGGDRYRGTVYSRTWRVGQQIRPVDIGSNVELGPVTFGASEGRVAR